MCVLHTNNTHISIADFYYFEYLINKQFLFIPFNIPIILEKQSMQNIKIYEQRISHFIWKLTDLRYSNHVKLKSTFIYDKDNPIPFEQTKTAQFNPISTGEIWGEHWGSSWFKFEATVPETFKNQEVVALIDIQAEGCVWVDGVPYQGLTYRAGEPWFGEIVSKRMFPLFKKAVGNEAIEILVEGAANQLGGGKMEFKLVQAELVVLHRIVWDLYCDFKVLDNLFRALPEKSIRRKKILHGLNEAVNCWHSHVDTTTADAVAAKCRVFTKELLAVKNGGSALIASSIGHGHIDLGWLWPVRETKRKGGRTFSTALKLMDEYPQYKFGASQPQLYQWIKEQYPALYARIKQAIVDKRWECQGAAWVEPDTNITGGESLVRQCLYGKRFFRDEFGLDIRNLWLPDCFGFSGQLPQILKKSGVDYFVSQKISWGDTNQFPHTNFMWEGIDGSQVLAHFLPANNYNVDNMPGGMIDTEQRCNEPEIFYTFLSLYGIGDGGGGPSRKHIEYALRMQDCEGVPKVKFEFAQEALDRIGSIPKEKLAVWKGELYLEYHRGVYTTQARMKKENRILENKLRTVEFLASLTSTYPKDELEKIWKGVLLNQFHDILPGSSIKWVYDDAHRESVNNCAQLDSLQQKALDAVLSTGPGGNPATSFAVWNTLSWDRTGVVRIPQAAVHAGKIVDSTGKHLHCKAAGSDLDVEVSVPSMGYTVISVSPTAVKAEAESLKVSTSCLENELVRVNFDPDGTISSVFDKTLNREMLSGRGNLLQLWDDHPNSWDAWDINHFYREVKPVAAKLTGSKVLCATPFIASIEQTYTIGSSTISQVISVKKGSAAVFVETTIDWKESHKMLRASFDTSVTALEATFEIQFGTIRRPTHANTSWDWAKFEVCGHRFADLSQPGFGAALLNDCKYGYSVHDTVMELNLLRSPKSPDETADMHIHQFTYAFLPHSGDYIQSTVYNEAHELNTPLITQPVLVAPEASHSYYRVDKDNIRLETVKRSEDGTGRILRLFERSGIESSTTVTWKVPCTAVYQADLLERYTDSALSKEQQVTLKFKPFEIITLFLKD